MDDPGDDFRNSTYYEKNPNTVQRLPQSEQIRSNCCSIFRYAGRNTRTSAPSDSGYSTETALGCGNHIRRARES